MPVSDADSGGLSDPAFERHYAALPKLEDWSERRLHSPSAKQLALITSVIALVVIIAMLFFPEAVGSIAAR